MSSNEEEDAVEDEADAEDEGAGDEIDAGSDDESEDELDTTEGDTEGDDEDESESDTTTTTNQRLVFTIPSPSTTMVLGSRHWNNVGYEGYSVITTGHVYLLGADEESRIALEAYEQVTITSSEGEFTAQCKEDMLLSTEERAYFAAGKSVFISAGASHPQTPGVGVFTSATPEEAEVGSKIAGHLEKAEKKIETAVEAASITTGVLSVLNVLCSTNWQAFAAQVIGGTIIAIEVLNHLLRPKYEGEVTVYGMNAATICSASVCNVVAGNSAYITAPLTTVQGEISAQLMAGIEAGLTGGISATLTGYVHSQILSIKHVLVAARRGSVHINAPHIAIGEIIPTNVLQSPTKHVQISSASGVAIDVGMFPPYVSGFRLEMTAADLFAQEVSISATERAGVNVGMFGLEVGLTDGAMLVNRLSPDAEHLAKHASSASFKAQMSAAVAAYDLAVNTLAAAMAPEPTVAALLAAEIRSKTLAVARKTLKLAAKLAKSSPGFPRVGVSAAGAEMAAGIGKIMIGPTGNIIIDGMGMPIVIQSGAGQIMVTPAGVKLGPIVVQG